LAGKANDGANDARHNITLKVTIAAFIMR